MKAGPHLEPTMDPKSVQDESSIFWSISKKGTLHTSISMFSKLVDVDSKPHNFDFDCLGSISVQILFGATEDT